MAYTICMILVLAGVVFAFFGLTILPVARSVALNWISAIYGSVMMGWGVTLIRRVALDKDDPELTGALVAGLTVWLLSEAAFSICWRVWFNVGVDIVVLALFLVPLTWKSR